LLEYVFEALRERVLRKMLIGVLARDRGSFADLVACMSESCELSRERIGIA
jgi:hypothetical protein